MRIAFKMSIHPGMEAEYTRRHNPIWQELEQTLLEHGVLTYSIFLDRDTNTLFAYAEIESEEQWQSIATTEICQKWWKYMAPLMPSNADYSPISHDLVEVFHLEKKA